MSRAVSMPPPPCASWTTSGTPIRPSRLCRPDRWLARCDLRERADLGEGPQRLPRRLLVDPRDGEADMHEHPVPDLRLGHVGEGGLPLDTGEVPPAHAQLRLARDLDHLPRHREAHGLRTLR